jgi:hypothetical protein
MATKKKLRRKAGPIKRRARTPQRLALVRAIDGIPLAESNDNGGESSDLDQGISEERIDRSLCVAGLHAAWGWFFDDNRPPLTGPLSDEQAIAALQRIVGWCNWAGEMLARGTEKRPYTNGSIKRRVRAMSEAIEQVRDQFRAVDLRNVVILFALRSANELSFQRAIADSDSPMAKPEHVVVEEAFVEVVNYALSTSPELGRRLRDRAHDTRNAIRLLPDNRRESIFQLHNILSGTDKPRATSHARRDVERSFDAWLKLKLEL